MLSKFKPYYNKTVDEITNSLPVEFNRNAKSFYANLTKAILNIELNKEIDEFAKADIVVKTVRLKANNLPAEDISFKAFNFKDLIKENWDESVFKQILERKFLFIFFQMEDDQLILRKVKFWNMPFQDIEKAKKVWIKTRSIIRKGDIVREITDKGRKTNFPNKKFNPVSHVRPHAQNAMDTCPLPKMDNLTKANEYTKHGFWLNNSYIKDEIYLKQSK